MGVLGHIRLFCLFAIIFAYSLDSFAYTHIILVMSNAQQARDYDRINNEGGEGYNPYADKIEARVDVMFDSIKGRTESEWTRDVTIERRAAWNAAIAWVAAKHKSGQISDSTARQYLRDQEAEIGFLKMSLDAAVERHGL